MACKLPDTLTALPVGLRENTIIDAYFAGKGTSGPKPDIEGMGLSVNDDRYLNFTIKTMQDQMSALASCLTDTLMVNARSWLFLENFEWFFGRYPELTKDEQKAIEKVLKQEIDYVTQLPPSEQFITPWDYQTKIFPRNGLKPRYQLPALPAQADARARFVHHLRVNMLGMLMWEGGRGADFKAWLDGGAQGGLPRTALLNCWELVFYSAIQSGFVDPKVLKPMYTDGAAFKAAFPGISDSGSALLKTFEAKLSPRLDASKDTPDLRAGDIIISNWGGKANHVFALVSQEKPVTKMRAIQLWGNSGAGITFYTNFGDFLQRAGASAQAEDRSYFVLRLDA
ncbi:hypothetical protein LTS17_001583 [Exophiala oligosperma]